MGPTTASPVVAVLTSAAQMTSESGSTATWALPVGHPPVNWETLRLAWLLLSSSRDSPQPESTAAHRAVPEAVAADDGLAPPGVGGAKSPHMAATSRSGMPAMTRAPACER